MAEESLQMLFGRTVSELCNDKDQLKHRIRCLEAENKKLKEEIKKINDVLFAGSGDGI